MVRAVLFRFRWAAWCFSSCSGTWSAIAHISKTSHKRRSSSAWWSAPWSAALCQTSSAVNRSFSSVSGRWWSSGSPMPSLRTTWSLLFSDYSADCSRKYVLQVILVFVLINDQTRKPKHRPAAAKYTRLPPFHCSVKKRKGRTRKGRGGMEKDREEKIRKMERKGRGAKRGKERGRGRKGKGERRTEKGKEEKKKERGWMGREEGNVR